jgi:hypothetical protein
MSKKIYDILEVFSSGTQSSNAFIIKDGDGNTIFNLEDSGKIRINNSYDLPTALGSNDEIMVVGAGGIEFQEKETYVGGYIDTITGVTGGIAGLDNDGNIPLVNLPAIAVTNTYEAGTTAGMLGLTQADTGDLAIRTDLNKTFVLAGPSYSEISDWKELLTPTDVVQSVNGQTGALSIDLSDVLVAGNTTGINNIQVSNNAIIKSADGGNTFSQIDFNYGGNPRAVQITNDSGGYNEGAIGIYNWGTAVEEYRPGKTTYIRGPYVQIQGNFVNFPTIEAAPTIYVAPESSELGIDNLGPQLGSYENGILVQAAQSSTSSVALDLLDKKAIAVHINTSGSTYKPGVLNSVILGGSNETIAQTDNTAYVQQVGFYQGETIEGILTKTGTLTGSRTWYLPDENGTITLGTGTSSQVSYWTDTNIVTSNSGFTTTGNTIGLGDVSADTWVGIYMDYTSTDIQEGIDVTISNTASSVTAIWASAAGVGGGNKVGVYGQANGSSDGYNIGIHGNQGSGTPGGFAAGTRIGGLFTTDSQVVDGYAIMAYHSASSNNDAYGISVDVSNSGAGNAYIGILKDGTQGAGKVLTSDANGVATWQTPAGVTNLNDIGDVDTSGVSNGQVLTYNGGTWSASTVVTTDTNGIFDATNDGGTVSSGFEMNLTNTLDIGNETLYIDDTNNSIGIGTSSTTSTRQLVVDGSVKMVANSGGHYIGTKVGGGSDNIFKVYNSAEDVLWRMSTGGVLATDATTWPNTLISFSPSVGTVTIRNSAGGGGKALIIRNSSNDEVGFWNGSSGYLWAKNAGVFGSASATGLDILISRGQTSNSSQAALKLINSSGTSLMRVRNDGSVGLGTDTPSATLHVVGGTRISDLGGSGDQMVVTDNDGVLSTQAIPTQEGGGTVSGTTNSIAKFTGANEVGDSNITDTGTLITLASDVIIQGDFTVNGTTSTINTTNSVVSDSIIELANGTIGSPSNDAGLIIERGSETNVGFIWDESDDKFALVNTSDTAATSTVTISSYADTIMGNLEVNGTASVTNGLIVDTDTLYVDSVNDRVGIGVVPNATRLHIVNPNGGDRGIVLRNATYTASDSNAFIINQDDSGNVFLQNGGSTRITIQPGGNIGIGVTPTEFFHVGGNALIDNNLTVNDDLLIGTDALIVDSSEKSVAIGGATSADYTLNITGDTQITGTVSGEEVFVVKGTSGELFRITDSLTGSLFAVNNISGLPILEVFDDNTTLMGNFQAPALHTTEKVVTTAAGTVSIYDIPHADYRGGFFDYVVYNGATNSRAGTVHAIWDGTNIQYQDTSTSDIGDTSGVTMSVSLDGTNAKFEAAVDAADWTIKTIIRSI